MKHPGYPWSQTNEAISKARVRCEKHDVLHHPMTRCSECRLDEARDLARELLQILHRPTADETVERLLTVAGLYTPTVSMLRDCPVHGLVEAGESEALCSRPIIGGETCGLELDPAKPYLRMVNDNYEGKPEL